MLVMATMGTLSINAVAIPVTVGRSWSAGSQHYTGLACGTRIAVCGMGSPLLVGSEHVFYLILIFI